MKATVNPSTGARNSASGVSVERIEAAGRSIDPVFLNTPQFESEPLSGELGIRLVLKVETVNPIRCFKGRGTDLFVSRLPAESSKWFVLLREILARGSPMRRVSEDSIWWFLRRKRRTH